jgi:hypothetical protein
MGLPGRHNKPLTPAISLLRRIAQHRGAKPGGFVLEGKDGATSLEPDACTKGGGDDF